MRHYEGGSHIFCDSVKGVTYIMSHSECHSEGGGRGRGRGSSRVVNIMRPCEGGSGVTYLWAGGRLILDEIDPAPTAAVG